MWLERLRHSEGPSVGRDLNREAAAPQVASLEPLSPIPADEPTAAGDCVLQLLDCMGFGGILASSLGKIAGINETARRLLAGAEADDPSATPRLTHWELQARLQDPLRRLSRFGGVHWAVLDDTDPSPCLLSRLPVALPRGITALALVSLQTCPRPNAKMLHGVFALTNTEAEVAAAIAQGASPTELATRLNVSRNTVRTHLASIFAKTQTRRQPELVALLSRIALFP